MDHTVLPANYTNACLYLVSVHQMALLLNSDGVRLIAAYRPRKDEKAELAQLADLQRTVYPHKWSLVSCRSSESLPVKLHKLS